MYRTSLVVLVSLAALIMAPTNTLAVITLELRPLTQFTVAGQQTEVEVYAAADPGEPVGFLQVVLSRDENSLTLVGNHGVGAHPWALAFFPNGGLNSTHFDGTAFFSRQGCWLPR